jgi:hypothetical protein
MAYTIFIVVSVIIILFYLSLGVILTINVLLTKHKDPLIYKIFFSITIPFLWLPVILYLYFEEGK